MVGIFDEDARRWVSSRNPRAEVVQDRDLRAVSITQVVEALDRALRRGAAEASEAAAGPSGGGRPGVST